jgi:hypothetical protein
VIELAIRTDYRIALQDWILNRIIIVAYLYPPPIDSIAKYVENALDIKAVNVLNTNLKAYLEKGVMPPTEIATAVMNVADDIVANRAPTLRTGDYIALQMYMRKNVKQ